jgi:hypothetical protein
MGGRPEGALLVACVAVAAAARHQFPGMKDRAAFIGLLILAWTIPIKEVEFRGKGVAVENLLYQWVRCSLAHTATLPIDIGWIATPGRDDLAIRAGGAPEFKLLLPAAPKATTGPMSPMCAADPIADQSAPLSSSIELTSWGTRTSRSLTRVWRRSSATSSTLSPGTAMRADMPTASSRSPPASAKDRPGPATAEEEHDRGCLAVGRREHVVGGLRPGAGVGRGRSIRW